MSNMKHIGADRSAWRALPAVVGLLFLCRPLLAADPCTGLVQDKLPHPMRALAKPALGQTALDPDLGGRIRRITAVAPSATADAVIKPMYSTVAAWNADESRLILYKVGSGHQLYDGRTYAFVRALDIAPNDIEQVYWHATDPDVLFYPSGNRLMRYRVSSGAKETVHTFTFCAGSVSGGSDPMFTSWDSSTIGLQCDGQAILYRIPTDTVLATGLTPLGAPQAAASGNLAYLAGYVVNTSLGVVRYLDIANPYEHAGLGRTSSGRDTFNTVAFDGGPAGSGVGSLVTFDLADGTSRVIVGPATGYPYPPSGTHLSTVALRAPGWVFVSIVGNPSGAGVLDNELVLADTNTGRVCRAAHHRSWGKNNTMLRNSYWAEPHVVISPSGTRALFASDWGNGATVDTYVLELPSYQAGPLPTLKVDAPNGGERFVAGTTNQIRWTASGLDPAGRVHVYVRLGGNWQALADVPPTQTSLSWTVPDVGEDAALVSVGSLSSSGQWEAADTGDAPFTIARRPPFPDFDGDGEGDLVVFRGGAWMPYPLAGGPPGAGVWTGTSPGCIPAPMDHDGDGRTDFTQLCGGTWHFYDATGRYVRGILTGGGAGDRPAPADYDGDGRDDVVVFRSGWWLFFDVQTGLPVPARNVRTATAPFNSLPPVPAPMDYDGDGRADFTVYAGGPWHFFNRDGSYRRGIWTGGLAGDTAVPADYDGDGVDDIVVFRGGAWLFYDLASGTPVPSRNVWTGAPAHWYGGTSLPAPLDYDGDGAADFTVYSGGPWHLFNHDGSYRSGVWAGGVTGDRPISLRRLP
jgi:hypothetical protein